MGPGSCELDMPGNAEPAKKILRWCRFDARLLLRHLHFPSGSDKKLTTTGASFKVLVVDDSNTIRRSAEIFLKQGARSLVG